MVSPGTIKTTLDAWNGYHSLPLAPSARDATTFKTEWGRYRYLRAPQGFHAAGDGYTRRFDDITVAFPRQTKCVDDSLLWDQKIESAFWHTIDYLDLSAGSGTVLNPKKFHSGQPEVDFAGFTIIWTGFRPSKRLIDAILEFPTPTNIIGVRSRFGLVQQIAYITAVSPFLQPFRDLSKPDTPWYWDHTFDQVS